jgi:hypothetical protein
VQQSESECLELDEKSLRQWDLLADFRQALARENFTGKAHPSWSDRRRQTDWADYLSLFLFGLFNPVLKTTRALCAASRLPRVQREVSGGSFSLGSFSEAQHLTDPAWLQEVFGDLAAQVPRAPGGDVRQAWQHWFARDSSLFSALPRMHWALYGGGKPGAANRAVRLHLNFHLLEDKPAGAQITPGKACERAVWKQNWEAGEAYVGDRSFGQDHGLLGPLGQKGCRFVLRFNERDIINVEEELPLSQADREAGVQRQAWATLGCRQTRSVRVRVIWISMADGNTLRLVTNVPPEALAASEVGLLYRRRWQVECFFRWIKCLLGCRHWLAESPQGVAIQLYLALIAAVLFQCHTGRRPNQRMMELFQLHQLGWASTTDLIEGLRREQQRETRRKIKSC